ncbi:sn-1-specific diacylglycerol lipase ABHD11 isoform X3 [Anas platyrhynchos]|uniref:sn-1-specific diacylglycerol lipase ABHD11 isoform X3 n=1 Tax=Anas platyrhynchos TaxID=8839 RepID=UPI003AF2B1B6
MGSRARQHHAGLGESPGWQRAVPLSHAALGPAGPRPPLVLLHGLFGSRGNLQTAANALARRSGSQVLTLDARNHGSSPHSPVMTYEAMSLDVQQLLARLGIAKCIVLGHSMGGKTAMALALQRPDLVERLISVDISPVSTTLVSEFSAYISAMKSVNIPAGLSRSAARQLADSQLSPAVQHPQLRQFLLTNLVEVEGRYVWRVNLEAISHHLEDIMSFPVFHKPYPGPTLFLGGSNSPYISVRTWSELPPEKGDAVGLQGGAARKEQWEHGHPPCFGLGGLAAAGTQHNSSYCRPW